MPGEPGLLGARAAVRARAGMMQSPKPLQLNARLSPWQGDAAFLRDDELDPSAGVQAGTATPTSEERAGAWPAAGLSPGCRNQSGAGFLIALPQPPPALSPAAPGPQPPGHAGAWQRRGGSEHCGCPLRPGWRRKQGFPGPEQVLPVSSQLPRACRLRWTVPNGL